MEPCKLVSLSNRIQHVLYGKESQLMATTCGVPHDQDIVLAPLYFSYVL